MNRVFLPYGAVLTEHDCARLRSIAGMLGIIHSGAPERGLWIQGPTMRCPVHFEDYWRGHIRLLAEACELMLYWIPFTLGESCANTLLAYSDQKLVRISELCRVHAKAGSTPAECECAD